MHLSWNNKTTTTVTVGARKFSANSDRYHVLAIIRGWVGGPGGGVDGRRAGWHNPAGARRRPPAETGTGAVGDGVGNAARCPPAPGCRAGAVERHSQICGQTTRGRMRRYLFVLPRAARRARA